MTHEVGVILSRQAKDLLPQCGQWPQTTHAEYIELLTCPAQFFTTQNFVGKILRFRSE